MERFPTFLPEVQGQSIFLPLECVLVIQISLYGTLSGEEYLGPSGDRSVLTAITDGLDGLLSVPDLLHLCQCVHGVQEGLRQAFGHIA